MDAGYQHTTPLLISGSIADGSISKLQRVRFEKSGDLAQVYDENWVQNLVQLHPELLPVEEVEPAYSEVISVCTELPTSSGYIDNFFITPSGNLLFVECKLYRNPEARREVVAQVLDYAESLTGMTYEELEDAVKRAALPDGSKPDFSLYDLVPDDAELDEPAFIDAVSRNLKLGRGLFFIVGDGIREDVETLTDQLQSHAGMHFALALMELGLFQLPDQSGFVAQPRLITRTVNIERGIVRIEGEGISVKAPEQHQPTSKRPQAQTLSAEEFYECMAKLDPALPGEIRAFLELVEPLGVRPEFRRSMILRWRAIDGTAFNIGYIMINGEVWTDMINTVSIDPRVHAATGNYLAELATAIGGSVKAIQNNELKNYIAIDNKALQITQLLKYGDEWAVRIQELSQAVNEILDT